MFIGINAYYCKKNAIIIGYSVYKVLKICYNNYAKVDVFALGLLFHQYYTGNLPHFDTEKYTYAFEAVLDEGEIAIDESIPENIAEQIAAMLNKDPEMRPTLNQVFAKLSQPEHVAEKPEPEVPKSPIEPAKTYKDSSTSKTSFFKRADSDDLL